MPYIAAEMPRHSNSRTPSSASPPPAAARRRIRSGGVRLDAGTPAKPHSLTREEVFVVTSGSAIASAAGSEIQARSRKFADCSGVHGFQPRKSVERRVRGRGGLPVGGRAMLEDGVPFVPPWSV